ncbi:MAG: methyltransferase domain-containing protein [Pseudomonadales bacterium]|nr:methyltransferase domain-containing protein [Pseudomonadales bacterium]
MSDASGSKLSDNRIIESWSKNAAPWILAIQKKTIESRKLVTDQAIIDAVLSVSSVRVLDIGCGEGWLARALSSRELWVSGIDVIPELVEAARKNNEGEFHVMAYEELAEERIYEVFKWGQKFDTAVCNFSLLGKSTVEHIFKVLPSILHDSGYFIVQTLHPIECCSEYPYESGWREGSWEGFDDEFCDPAPWYFRTVEAWRALFFKNGFEIVQCREPVHPKTGKPASLLLIGKKI